MKRQRKQIRSRIIEAEIISNREIAPDHFVAYVKAPEIAKEAVPGQFLGVKPAENTTDPLLRIPLGVHDVAGDKVGILYKVVGKATRLLSVRGKKEKLNILGPLGKGFVINKTCRQGIIVAGGHGIAPLYFLARNLAKEKKKTTFFVGTCEKRDVVLEKEIKKLGTHILISTDDGSCGYKGFVTDVLEREIKRDVRGNRCGEIYACGPRPMLKRIAELAERYNISAQVSLDEYMACGIGVCLGCPVKTKSGYKLVCKDGPVFGAEEIVWE